MKRFFLFFSLCLCFFSVSAFAAMPVLQLPGNQVTKQQFLSAHTDEAVCFLTANDVLKDGDEVMLDGKTYLLCTDSTHAHDRGTDLAFKKRVTASSEQAGNPASHINDGNSTTRWSASDQILPQWIEINLGEPCVIDEICGTLYQDTVYDYELWGTLDGTDYYLLASGQNDAATGYFSENTFGTQTVRRVKMKLLHSSSSWASIYDMHIYGKSLSTAIPVSDNKPVTASSAFGAAPGNFITDGDMSTRWVTDGSVFPAHVTVDLGGTYVLDKLEGYIFQDTPGETYATYDIWVSIDGETFTPMGGGTSATINGYFVETDLTYAIARYVRINITGMYPGISWASICEVKIYAADAQYVLHNSSVKKVTASSEQAGNEKENILTDTTDTRWSASDATVPQWIELDFGEPKSIVAVTGKLYVLHNNQYSYKLQCSNDGVNYTTIATSRTDGSGNTFIHGRFYHRARYLRLRVMGTSVNGVWVSAYNINVYGFENEPSVADLHLAYEENSCTATLQGSGVDADDQVVFARYAKDGRLIDVVQSQKDVIPSITWKEDGVWSVCALVFDGALGGLKAKTPMQSTGAFPGTITPKGQWHTSSAFGSHMVLDHDEPCIYGFGAQPGEKIYASIGGVTAYGYGEHDGSFSVRFPVLSYQTQGQTLSVYNDAHREEFQDVLIGDVYLVGGQSNADYEWNRTDTYAADVARLDHNMPIRFFVQRQPVNRDQSREYAEPDAKFHWATLSSGTAGELSAIGWYFAEKLVNETNRNIPIGVVQISQPGARLQMLGPMEVSENYTAWEGATPLSLIGGAWIHNIFIKGFEKMRVSGMIYLQGESDSETNEGNWWQNANLPACTYTDRLHDMITYYRTQSKKDYPVFNLLLTTYNCDAWHTEKTRASQTQGYYEIDNYYAIATHDCGVLQSGSDTMHPPYKKPLGYRLADVALAVNYQTRDLDYTHGPLPKTIHYSGNTALITFDHVGSGLKTVGPNKHMILGFEAVLSTGEAVNVIASVVAPDQVRIETAPGTVIVGVRYGIIRYSTLSNTNMANSENKLMLPFMDGWEGPMINSGTLDIVHTPAENG